MAQPDLVSQPSRIRGRIPLETISLQTILECTRGTLRQGTLERGVSGLTTDSREVEPGEFFVALKGDRFDGHHYVELCARSGAGGAIVERLWVAPTLPTEFALVAVDDVLLAYQKIAACYRQSLSLKVVAITGSNGKTSTKDLTAAVLSQQFRVAKTQGNLNNHIGVPKTLLNAGRNDEVLVLEIGMNHSGEIAPLAAMAQPDVAVITNVGSAHIEFMKTRDAIAQEKGMLAEAVGPSGWVIMPADDDFAASIARRTAARVLTVGTSRGDLRAEAIAADAHGSTFQVVESDTRVDVTLPVPGRHMVINALLAMAVGRVRGIPLRDCAQGVARAQLTKGRLELKTVSGVRILDDSYNANPDSMIAALRTLKAIPMTGRRIAVLGRMGELGEFSEAGHRQVGDAVAAEQIDHLITVGSEARFIAENATASGMSNVTTAVDVAEAARYLGDIANVDDLVLVKGSRSAAMENVISALAAQRNPPAKQTVL